MGEKSAVQACPLDLLDWFSDSDSASRFDIAFELFSLYDHCFFYRDVVLHVVWRSEIICCGIFVYNAVLYCQGLWVRYQISNSQTPTVSNLVTTTFRTGPGAEQNAYKYFSFLLLYAFCNPHFVL
jgi:hypothetical protein